MSRVFLGKLRVLQIFGRAKFCNFCLVCSFKKCYVFCLRHVHSFSRSATGEKMSRPKNWDCCQPRPLENYDTQNTTFPLGSHGIVPQPAATWVVLLLRASFRICILAMVINRNAAIRYPKMRIIFKVYYIRRGEKSIRHGYTTLIYLGTDPTPPPHQKRVNPEIKADF